MMQNNFYCFIAYSLFLFLRYLGFCPKFFDHAGIRLDKKAKVNFKMLDVTT